jgi:hypothetical protein
MTISRRAAVPALMLVALVAVLPLIVYGCSCGHDFDFHLLSWMEAASQLRHGALYPHWAFTPAYNAGEPRFVFYPPLSWIIGAGLGLLMPWGATPIVYTWLAVTAAGLGCYRLLREFATPGIALLIAALYMVNPYMLFTAYERTAYAELLAAAWLPLLLHGILRRRVTVPGIALPVALLWLTNAPAAVIGCYGLALLAAVRLLLTLRKPSIAGTSARQLAFNTIAGTALGLGLAAVYIVPAVYERRYVQIAMAMVEGMRIRDNFLFHHTADAAHDAVLYTASGIAVGLLLVAFAGLLIALLRRREGDDARGTLYGLAVVTVAIGFLLTPLSASIWSHAPELAFLQFPWRFLALLAPVLAVVFGIALRGIPVSRTVGISLGAVIVCVLTYASYTARHQECDPEDTVAARLALFHSPRGSDPTDEYTPMTADNDVLGKADPPFWLAANAEAAPPVGSSGGPLHWPLDLDAPVPEVLILNLRNYPAWHISLNHHDAPRVERDDGLIAIAVPTGPLHVEITYARTADQGVGAALSAISLMLLIPLCRRRVAG